MTKSSSVPESSGKQVAKPIARLARLSVPKITVYQHVLKKYSKLGAGTPVLSVVFGEEVLLIAFLVWLCCSNSFTYV